MDDAAATERWAGDRRDPSFLRAVRPVLDLYASWFRPDVRGFERLPAHGPFLVVGNHSGGQTPPDLPVLLSAWWRERGEDEPVYALFHSFVMGTPGVATVLGRGGAVEANREAAEEILRKGGVLLDFPGGDFDVFRPWRDRNHIDFNGRLGFIRLALRTGVPVVPSVSIGAHETVVVLARGERLARALGIDRLLRIKVMPLVFGPPWGVVPGGIPTLPFPAKIVVELGEPFEWASEYGPEAADDDEIVQRCYTELTDTMQATLDRLATERRYPVLG